MGYDGGMTKRNLYLFSLAVMSYFIVDVLYNVLVGMKIDAYYYEKSGIIDIYALSPQAPVLFVLFFIIIGLANVVLVIQPSISVRSVSRALSHGFLLGVTAYGTFALPCAWSIKNYPLMLAFIHIVGGGVFSMVASGLTTYLDLRRNVIT